MGGDRYQGGGGTVLTFFAVLLATFGLGLVIGIFILYIIIGG